MALSSMSMRRVSPAGGFCSRRSVGSSAQRVLFRTHAATERNPLAQLSDSIGMPTEEGVFGFKPFAEVWVGRWAMLGFASSIVAEAVTGNGTLQQLHIATPSSEVLATLCGVLGLAVLAGTADTANKAFSRKLSPKDIARYKNFLSLNDGNDWMEAAAEMKRRGDFTDPRNDMALIEAARAEGMAADRVLAVAGASDEAEEAASAMKAADSGVLTLTKDTEAQQVAAAAAEMKAGKPQASTSGRAAAVDIRDPMFTSSAELAYARDVEITNGRYAMLGFLVAILVEAATGKGILAQLIMWAKLVGLLGPMSGF